MTSLFNDESLDVYKYQTLHDYNPIINKLMIQMAIGSSTLMKEMLQGRTEMFNMNAFTEVLYKKKKPSLNDEHNSHINTNKLF